MKAHLIRHDRVIDELNNIIEVKMWQLPKATKDKYSLVYIVNDERVIGYDNAEGKGDHKHIKGKIEPYKFLNLKKLSQDFYRDIERYKRGEL